MKPVIYVCNVDEKSVVTGNKHIQKALQEAVQHEHAEILFVALLIESEIAVMDSFEDRQMFLEDMGLKESGVAS